MRKVADIILTMVILAGVALLVLWLADGTDEEISGTAFVIDGDTVIIGQEKIRLKGIDAPELDQACYIKGNMYQCGVKARTHLQELSRSDEMRCSYQQRDKYGRLLGQCFIGETDINARMVSDGWAVSYYEYYEQEGQAEKLQRGIWAGEFERPADWRILRGNLTVRPNGEGKAWWKIW